MDTQIAGTFSSPLLKFIGEQEMVIPIMEHGYLLTHKALRNHYYPTVISLVDGDGYLYQYQKLALLKGISWWQSLKYVNILHRALPLLIEEPVIIRLSDLQTKVSAFVRKTPHSRGISQAEKAAILQKLRELQTHREVIKLIDSVSYWK